jgi:hypothetical protein
MSGTSELTGRALDVAVAEKLFGWRLGRGEKLTHRGWYPPEAFENGTPTGPYVVDDPAAPVARNPDYLVPHYSRDWAGAGLVVDEMRRRGWDADVKARPDTHYAEFSREARGGYECHYDAAPSVGVAVCRAALAAMEAAT